MKRLFLYSFLFILSPVHAVTTFSSGSTINTTAAGVYSVKVVDLDKDGHLDIVSGSAIDNKVAWYKNDGNNVFATETLISSNAVNLRAISIADLNNDGYDDVLSASVDDNKIAWYQNNGNGTISTTQQIISSSVGGAHSLYVADLDNDGDMDVISAALFDNAVYWHKNNGDGSFAVKQSIATLAGPATVSASDLDNDGDMDILAASSGGNKVVWFQNNRGSFSSEKPISVGHNGAIEPKDIDNDGVMDVIIASANNVSWYKNQGNGVFTAAKLITNTLNRVRSIYVADLDNDGDADVLTASDNDNTIAWYENTGQTISTTKQIISGVSVGASSVYAADLDKDGDVDILSALFNGNKFTWFENKSAKRNVEIKASIDITNTAIGAYSVFSADLNNDGLLDIVSGSALDNKVAWYKNNGNNAFSAEQVISTNAINVRAVYAADINNDGFNDVLSASINDNKIAWYQNNGDGSISSTQKIISSSVAGAGSLYATDVDNDGDIDVVSAAYYGNAVFLHKNNGNGTFAIKQSVGSLAGASSVYASDLDGDGNIDILATSGVNNKAVWYKNNKGSFASEKIIATTNAGAINATDIDSDGDMDVIVVGVNTAAWYKNNGNGVFETAQLISSSLNSVRSVVSADLDNDGDKDVLTASFRDNTVAWFENTGKSISTVKKIISSEVKGATSVFAVDIDNDGDLDVLASSHDGNQIKLFNNLQSAINDDETDSTTNHGTTPIQNIESIKSLSIVSKVLTALPIKVVNAKEENFTAADGSKQLVVSGEISFDMPINGGSSVVTMHGGQLLVLAETKKGELKPSTDSIFIKYKLHDFLKKGLPNVTLSKDFLDNIPNVEMVIGYSNSYLDEKAINTLPQTVQDYFKGIFSPKFGIPIFNRTGSFNIFLPLGLDKLPIFISKPLADLGIDQPFVSKTLGVDGSLVYTAALANVNFIMDLMSLLFPDVDSNGFKKITAGVDFQIGVILPAASLPEWLTAGVGKTPLFSALSFEPNAAVQFRQFITVAAGVAITKADATITLAQTFEAGMRFRMPNLINANSLKDAPGTEPLDARVTISNKLVASLRNGTFEAGIEGTLRLVNDWVTPMGIPGISVGQAVLKLNGSVVADSTIAGVGGSFTIGYAGQFSCLDDENKPIGTPKETANIVKFSVLYQPPAQVIIKPVFIGVYSALPNLTFQQSLKCAVGVQMGISLGMGDTLVALLPEPAKSEARALNQSATGDIKTFVNNVLEKPLEFPPIALVMDQLRLNNGVLYVATPGAKIPNYIDSFGVKLSGALEYRKDRNTNVFTNVGSMDISGSFGGIIGKFALGDFAIKPIISMSDTKFNLVLKLAPPTADLDITGKQTLFNSSSDVNVGMSLKKGIKIKIDSNFENVAKAEFILDSVPKTLLEGLIDFKGSANYSYDIDKLSANIHAAISQITNSASAEYRNALAKLDSTRAEETALMNRINTLVATKNKDQEAINAKFKPVYDVARSALNFAYSRAAGHDRTAANWRSALNSYHWWQWLEKGIALAAIKVNVDFANIIRLTYPALITAVNNAEAVLNTVSKRIREKLDPEINFSRGKLAGAVILREGAQLILRALDSANNVVKDISSSVNDLDKINIKTLSGTMNSFIKYDDRQEPISILFEMEIAGANLSCSNRFNVFKGRPDQFVGGIIETVKVCISNRKAEVKTAAIQQFQKVSDFTANYKATNATTVFNSTKSTAATLNVVAINDNVANAIVLSGNLPITTTASNEGATLEADEFDKVAQTASLWWQWQPTRSGVFELTTTGAGDTAIHIHQTSDVKEQSLIVADVRPIDAGKITYYFDANKTYYIAVSSQFSDPGTFNLAIRLLADAQAESNDNFANAKVISQFTGSDSANNRAATVEEFETATDNLANNSQWWQYVAPETGVYTFDSYGTEFDTVMRVYLSSNNNIADAVWLKTSDDVASDPRASINVRLIKGQSIKLSIASKHKGLGTVELNWRYEDLPENKWLGDNFSSAISLVTADKKVTVSNLGATSEKIEPLHASISNNASVWFSFSPSVSGSYLFDTQGSNFDTVMALYTGTAINQLSVLAANDDAYGVTSRVKHDLTAGQTYMLAIAGKSSEEGKIQLSYAINDSNDNFANSLALTGNGGTFDADLTDAGLQTDEPQYELILSDSGGESDIFSYFEFDELDDDEFFEDAFGDGLLDDELDVGVVDGDVDDTEFGLDDFLSDADYTEQDLKDLALFLNESSLKILQAEPLTKSLWWKFTATEAGQFEVDSLQSEIDTAIIVFFGDSLLELQPLEWNDNAENALGSKLRLTVETGVTYHIAITSREAAKATIQWQFVNKANQSVSNDIASGASVLVSNLSLIPTGSVVGNNTYAGANNKTESDAVKQLFIGQSNQRLWWKFNPNDRGFITLDTLNTSLDTVLAVYEVNVNGKLTLIASNNDITQNSNTSRVRIAVKKDANYLVVTDTLNNQEGKITLNYKYETNISNALVNDKYATATVISGNNVNLTVSNNFAQYQNGEPIMGTINRPNAIWYKWKAPQTGKLNVTSNSNKVDTLLGIFQGDTLKKLISAGINDDSHNNTTNSAINTIVEKDETYYIALATRYDTQASDIVLQLALAPISLVTVANATIDLSEQWDSNKASIQFVLNHSSVKTVTGSTLVKGNERQATSRWYLWSAPSDGQYTFDGKGSELVLELEVYQGQSANSIVLVGQDSIKNGKFSEVIINAKVGQPYYVRVTSVFESQGNVTLNFAKTGDYVAPTNAIKLITINARIPAKITEAGTYNWQWQATDDGVAGVFISPVSNINRASLKVYLINQSDNSTTLLNHIEDNSNQDRNNLLFQRFNASKNQQYKVELIANEAIYGDAQLLLGYTNDKKVTIKETVLDDAIVKIKTLVASLLDNRLGSELDEWLIEDEIITILTTLFSAETVNPDDLYFDLEVASEDGNIIEDGIAKAKSVRLVVYNLSTDEILLALDFDPEDVATLSKEAHSQVAIDGGFQELTFKLDDANTLSSKVALEMTNESFKQNVKSAFVSVSRKSISDYANRTITPQFQSNNLYEFNLNIFTADSGRYDFDIDGGRSIINGVKVRLPVDVNALRNWLNDASLSVQEETNLINQALSQGKLKIITAKNVEDMLNGESEDLETSKTAQVNMTEAYVEFTTNHFSSFVIVEATNTVTDDNSGEETKNSASDETKGFGCTLSTGQMNNTFDPMFYILLVIAVLGLRRRSIYRLINPIII